MKPAHLLFCFLLLLATFTGCQKRDVVSMPPEYVGVWDWKLTYTVWNHTYPKEAGYTVQLHIERNGNYYILRNNSTLVGSGCLVPERNYFKIVSGYPDAISFIPGSYIVFFDEAEHTLVADFPNGADFPGYYFKQL